MTDALAPKVVALNKPTKFDSGIVHTHTVFVFLLMTKHFSDQQTTGSYIVLEWRAWFRQFLFFTLNR